MLCVSSSLSNDAQGRICSPKSLQQVAAVLLLHILHQAGVFRWSPNNQISYHRDITSANKNGLCYIYSACWGVRMECSTNSWKEQQSWQLCPQTKVWMLMWMLKRCNQNFEILYSGIQVIEEHYRNELKILPVFPLIKIKSLLMDADILMALTLQVQFSFLFS